MGNVHSWCPEYFFSYVPNCPLILLPYWAPFPLPYHSPPPGVTKEKLGLLWIWSFVRVFAFKAFSAIAKGKLGALGDFWGV
jgi:hypothetical protein